MSLGVNAVELLPVFEYDELELQRWKNPRWAPGPGALPAAARTLRAPQAARREGPERAKLGRWRVHCESLGWRAAPPSLHLPQPGRRLALCRRSFNREHMVNVWGYSHISFFSPMTRFGCGEGPVAAARDFKTMVKE